MNPSELTLEEDLQGRVSCSKTPLTDAYNYGIEAAINHPDTKYWWGLPGPVIAIADAIIQEWQRRRESGAPAIAFETGELAQFIAKLQPPDSTAPQGWQQGAAREILKECYDGAGYVDESVVAAIITRHQEGK